MWEHLAKQGPHKARPSGQVAAHGDALSGVARKNGGLELLRAGGHSPCEVILRLYNCLYRRHRRRRHGGQGLPVLPRSEQIQLLFRGANLEQELG